MLKNNREILVSILVIVTIVFWHVFSDVILSIKVSSEAQNAIYLFIATFVIFWEVLKRKSQGVLNISIIVFVAGVILHVFRFEHIAEVTFRIGLTILTMGIIITFIKQIRNPPKQ
jgi:hypothetical protein